MPVITAWIDELREACGREAIDAVIRRGLRGEGVFYATENGHEVGTPSGQPGVVLSVDPVRRREK